MFGKKNDNGGSPAGLPRITRIELTQKNLPLRLTLLALAVVIAIVAIGYGLSQFFGSTAGWTPIECTSGEANCSRDFVLNYNLGASGESATTENKKITTLYTQAAVDAYRIFGNAYTDESLHNLYYVNQNINQEITVDPALYKAFSVIVEAQNRAIFLAPVYAQYRNLIPSDHDGEANLYDPTQNPEQAAYIAQAVTFTSNPAIIDLQLLGDNKVQLYVAQEYVQFAEENEQEYFLDFSWMTNAFIADYLADTLIANGFTRGYITSYDGFTRNLCPETENFSLNLFHRVEKDIFMPGTLQYSGGRSLVSLRNFPLTDADYWNYYVFSDGRIASFMIDPVTGLEKQAVSNLVSYSKTAGCSEILMKMMPIYLADALDRDALNALKEAGIFSIYGEENSVYCNDPDGVVMLNPNHSYKVETF